VNEKDARLAYESEGDLTIPESQITEITPESNPDI
jgi:hypothetical protein